mmetsp:Transcript_39528/g.119470  ORF Transcript_39528/g.119470 Transcript_39528/m.119470 type:complete len:352 (-) Transcript_39528:544-1599(-)
MEHGELSRAVLHGEPPVCGVVRHHAREDPLPRLGSGLLLVQGRAGNIRQVVGVWVLLLAHADVLDLLGVLHLRGVRELLELLAHLVVVHHLSPLAPVVGNVVHHHLLELGTDPQLVLDDDLLQVLDAARELLQPWRSALEVLRRGDVIHEEAVGVSDGRGLVDVRRQQDRMLRPGPAVAADVEVVPLRRGDHAEVLALRLGALPQAPRDRHFDLVRGADPLVAVLQRDGHADGVLLPEAAPGAADAALHRAQRLPVGVPRLQPRLHQLAPDLGKLMLGRSVHAQALGACDLGPQAVLLRGLANGDQLVGGDVPAGAAGNHGVCACLLDVREEPVVGVLDLVPTSLQYVLIP